MLVVNRVVKTKLLIIDVEEDMIIFEQGEQDETMYMVIEGSVKIYDIQDEKEHQIELVKKYGIFGEAEMYSHNPRSVSAKTTTEHARLVVIKTEADLETLVTANPWLFSDVMETMGDHLSSIIKLLTAKKMEEIAKHKDDIPEPEVVVQLNTDTSPTARRIVRNH